MALASAGPVRASDHEVKFLSEGTIHAKAREVRALCTQRGTKHSFNIVKFITDDLKPKIKGGLEIKLVNGQLARSSPAYVSYYPLTLAVEAWVWSAAEKGDPEARWILAHELGHVFLHDATAQAYDPSGGKAFIDKNYSAEWQADVFASALLMPEESVAKICDAYMISMLCVVPMECAEERLASHKVFRNNRSALVGDLCACGEFFVRDGTVLRCSTCGTAVEV